MNEDSMVMIVFGAMFIVFGFLSLYPAKYAYERDVPAYAILGTMLIAFGAFIIICACK